jgi:hypothetical protein
MPLARQLTRSPHEGAARNTHPRRGRLCYGRSRGATLTCHQLVHPNRYLA